MKTPPSPTDFTLGHNAKTREDVAPPTPSGVVTRAISSTPTGTCGKCSGIRSFCPKTDAPGDRSRQRRYGANASSTFPGTAPLREYPDVTNTMPPATTTPGPSMEPPRAFTPLTVSNSRMVLKSHSTFPSAVA